ncbi:alcohol acetyltransferase [Mycena albidolilacea]|uniref:Alcohol acetyltransferase n=1 Tax=Mycena albidolilacea TaxID=1033008 RepID=A0AAD7AC84_9AGAR|nr:alcohol acetyltransferase [Mycena albidolilacea]
MSTLHHVRPLSFLEKYYTTRHFLGMDACVVTSARYTTTENTPLTKELLFPALRILIEAHAALGVRIEGKEDTADLAFVRLPTVDVSRLVEFSTSSNVQEALEKHLSHGLENTQGDLPLWRLEVLADNTVVFAAHHSIGDGLSHTAFHNSLLRALQETPSSTSSSSVVIPELTLLPPIEDVADIRPTVWHFLAALYELLAPKSWQKSFSAWTGKPVPTVIAVDTRVRLLQFKPSEATRFAEACRAHGATVTSTLYVLSVSVLARLLTSDPRIYKTVSVLIPLSLRPVFGIASDVFGNYISSHNTYPALDSAFSWATAARFAAELQEQRSTNYRAMGMLRLVEKQYARFFMGTLGKKRRFGFALSNLGRFEAPSVEGSWSIGEMFFSPCDSLTGAALGISAVGDPTGGLNITFKWGAESLDTEFVEEFTSLFRDAFLGLSA